MKKRVIAVLMCLIMAVLCSSVYATFDGNFLLKYSAKTVKAGQTVTVVLSVKDITGTNVGVESIEGYINIDKNIIEPLTVESIKTNDNGKVVIGTQELNLEDLTNATNADSIKTENGVSFNGTPISGNDSKIIIDLPTAIKEDTDVLTVEFKVKADAPLGEVEDAIKYDMFVMYSGTEMTTSAKSSITLTIEEAETETPDDTNKDENKDPSTAEHEHSWKENTSKSEAATCTEDGYKYYECTVTDCTETKKETVKAAGHKYGDWKVTKEATVSAEGEETRTCSVCNEKETRVIAKLQETNTNDESNNTANNILSQGNSTDTTTAKTVLPNTGIKTIILPAILLIIVAYVSYNKYIKYKDI